MSTLANVEIGKLHDLADLALDALDDAPHGEISGEASFEGKLATVQWLSGRLRCSDSTTRLVLHRLREAGLVTMFIATDSAISRRRLFITAGA